MKERVCLDIFTFMLIVAPVKVKIAPGSMTDHGEEVRRVAQWVSASLAANVPMRCGSWRMAYLGDTREPVSQAPRRRKPPPFEPPPKGGRGGRVVVVCSL